MFQTKKQDKIPEELNDMKIGIYSQRVHINKDKELRRMSAEWEARSFKQRVRKYKE